MLRLLNIELQKIKLNKAAKVITSVYFLLIIAIALIASIEFNFANVNFRIADQGFFNFPFIWHFNTYVAGILKLFLAIIIVSMMSNEYSYRTLKQNLIDGMSKKEFITSKFLTVLLFAVVSTIFVFLVSLVLGIFFSDHTELAVVFRDMEYLFAYFIKLVGFFSFCLFLGILVKRSAFALGFLLIWQIIEWIMYGVLKWQLFKDTDVAENSNELFPFRVNGRFNCGTCYETGRSTNVGKPSRRRIEQRLCCTLVHYFDCFNLDRYIYLRKLRSLEKERFIAYSFISEVKFPKKNNPLKLSTSKIATRWFYL